MTTITWNPVAAIRPALPGRTDSFTVAVSVTPESASTMTYFINDSSAERRVCRAAEERAIFSRGFVLANDRIYAWRGKGPTVDFWARVDIRAVRDGPADYQR